MGNEWRKIEWKKKEEKEKNSSSMLTVRSLFLKSTWTSKSCRVLVQGCSLCSPPSCHLQAVSVQRFLLEQVQLYLAALEEELRFCVLGTAPGNESRQEHLIREVWCCMVWAHLSAGNRRGRGGSMRRSHFSLVSSVASKVWGTFHGWSAIRSFSKVFRMCVGCVVLDLKRNRHTGICCITCSFRSRIVACLGQTVRAACSYMIPSHQVELCIVN